MPLELIGQTEWTRTFRLQSGAHVTLVVEEDDLSRVTALDAQGRCIGGLNFREIEDDHRTYYKLTWAFLDKLGPAYVHQGIGRAALQFWCSLSGEAAAVERYTGIPNDEGSELTGDAPPFVEKMVAEGLLYYQWG
jgi:RimJ/RimL family protein N-acetyltransferase